MGPIRLPPDDTDSPGVDQTDDVRAVRHDHVEKQASYPGEDTSFTTQRELYGW
jgi:hypothetical protein